MKKEGVRGHGAWTRVTGYVLLAGGMWTQHRQGDGPFATLDLGTVRLPE